LHNDKDHQIFFLGGPNVSTNVKMAVITILKKMKNHRISETVQPVTTTATIKIPFF